MRPPGNPNRNGNGSDEALPGTKGYGIAAPAAGNAPAHHTSAQATATAPSPHGGWRDDNPGAGANPAARGVAQVLAQTPPPAAGGALSDQQRAAAKGALKPLVSAGAGFVVLDAGGNEVDGHDADVPAVPASTVKVLTATVALATLGPGYRFHTILKALGPIRGAQIDGALALIGKR